MSRRQVWAAVVCLLAAGVLVYAGWFRHPPSAEELLKQKIVRIARAAEQKDSGFIVEQASERFRSANGLTKAELRPFLMGHFFGAQWLRVFISDLDVRLVGPKTAEVSGSFIFGRSRAESLKDLAKESTLGHYALHLTAEQESDGEWRFVWARYQPMQGAEPQ
jgi:hypothetical protein